MFEKFKTLVFPTYKNGWKGVYPKDGSKNAVILVKGNIVVADVVFYEKLGIFDGDTNVYAEHEVLKFYEYDS